MFLEQDIGPIYHKFIHGDETTGYRGTFPYYEMYAECEVKLAGIDRDDSVADLGAGTGIVSEKVIEHYPRQLLVQDISPSMLSYANRNIRKKARSLNPPYDLSNYTLLVCDLMKIEEFLQPESYDVAIASCVMYRLPDFRNALNKIAHILKRGGVSVFNMDSSSTFFTDEHFRTSLYDSPVYEVLIANLNNTVRDDPRVRYILGPHESFRDYIDRRFTVSSVDQLIGYAPFRIDKKEKHPFPYQVPRDVFEASMLRGGLEMMTSRAFQNNGIPANIRREIINKAADNVLKDPEYERAWKKVGKLNKNNMIWRLIKE